MKKYIQFIPFIGMVILFISYPDVYWGKYDKYSTRPYGGTHVHFFTSIIIQIISLITIFHFCCKFLTS